METILTKALARNDLPAAPNSTNGAIVTTDFSVTQTFVKQESKIVTNPDGSLNLRDSIARAIYVKSGATGAKPAVSATDILSARNAIACHIARHDFMTIMTHTDQEMAIQFRKADTVKETVWATTDAPTLDAHRKAADAIMAALESDESVGGSLKLSGKFTVLCVVANAISRNQTKGHNWYSDTSVNSTTPGGKALAVAAGDISEFADFMQTNGHDLFHFLSDETLERFCNFITGYETAKTNIELTVDSTVYPVGTEIENLFNVEDSAKDRWPPGELGLAGAILAPRVFKATIVDIFTRKPDLKGDTDAILDALTDYEKIVSADDFTRARAIIIKNVMKKSFAFCYGYITVFSDYEERFKKNASLVAWAEQESGEMILGNAAGKWAKDAKKDDAAIAEILSSFLKGMASAFTDLQEKLAGDVAE